MFAVSLSLNVVAAVNQTADNVLSVADESSPQELEISDDVENGADSNNLSSDGGKTFEITQISYEKYFNPRDGKILPNSGISSGDTIKIGNISNRAFVIDRPLTVMPITQNDKITNGYIHLIKGSDGSTITNLTINNTKGTLTFRGVTVGQLHGIWLTNSNNNFISYNTIRIANAAGVYAMPMGWSSNNRIVYNDMKTYISSVMIMGQCHYNLISHNSLEVLSYSDMSVTNLIYFNPFNHADYSGSPLCLGNVISYNYLKGFCSLPMSIIIQMSYANHDGTVIANNTVLKGSFGINLQGNNLSVYGNVVDNSATGISVTGSNFTVHDNSVSGSSQKCGIQIAGRINSTCDVYANNVTFTDVVSAMSIFNSVTAHDNIINVKGYGVGVAVGEDNSKVYDNRIKVNHDDGITILGNGNEVDNNIIITNARGVSIPAKDNGIRYYNNTISRNTITSDSHGVYIAGLVYRTTIIDNVIETNSSVGIYKDITDELSNIEQDNMINGVILKSTAIVVNDSNYYDYFDRNGVLTYTFPEGKTKVMILTFLTNKNIILNEKINVISNKQSNLLFNVTITIKSNASGSLVRDFNFINSNRKAIVLDNVNDVSIVKNNINSAFNKAKGDNSVIIIRNVCENSVISNNNLFINSKISNVYAISANDRKLSKGFLLANNTMIIISSKDCEAISVGSLNSSQFISNNINIIADGEAYGFNIKGRLSDMDVCDNEIIIHSLKKAYLVNLQGVTNTNVSGNKLYGQSNEIYGISANDLKNASIMGNALSVFTQNSGNSIINSDCRDLVISDNLIYTNTSKPIFVVENVENNVYVIDNNNYNIYFDEEGCLRNDLIGGKSTLLLYNLTDNRMLKVNSDVDISSYDAEIPISASIILDVNASNSRIYGITLINSTLILNNSSNVIIQNNAFVNSSLTVNGGQNNHFKYNNVTDLSKITIINSKYNQISNNCFNVSSKSKIISLENACDTLIGSNIINASSDSLVVISSNASLRDNVTGNEIYASGNSVYGYDAFNSKQGEFTKNNVYIDGEGIKQAGVSLTNSSGYMIGENRIISHSKKGGEYAVEVISNSNLSNFIVGNYLISSNGLKYADVAVNAKYDVVDLNTPRDIFVSSSGSDETGDGSESNPYASISKAIKNALNYSVIYVSGGNYNESNIQINKNLTLMALGNAVIDANTNQLFNISLDSTFSISGFKIRNAHNVEGGSVFINNGKLIINNSFISDSSSYFDNSHPEFSENRTYDDGGLKTAYTVDCKNTGMGGAILNKGELIINSSVFSNNLGHYGGAIANLGKTSIESTLFINNLGVHGGTIYSNTTYKMSIRNSLFNNNTALTTLDYCKLRLYSTGWSIDEGNRHQIGSDCDLPLGVGGAIYANNDMLIENSEFISNSARSGGAIATHTDLPDLEIKNSTFLNNRANDTRRSLGSNNLNYFAFSRGYAGGAISGNFNKFHISDSEFYFNQAVQNGGAIQARAKDGKIIDSIFTDNTAGISGGALDISDNFIVMRTVISNNSASYGGAIEYDSSVYYGHIQNHLNIYNSTISGNKALTRGGAFNFGSGNISVHDSNIADNFAPSGNTISTSGTTNAIDMRYNYWGASSGPDDSVWSVANTQFRPWYGQWISWNPTVSGGDSPSKDDGHKDNTNPVINPKHGDNSKPSGSTNTGSSTSTGTTIGGKGNWGYTGSGDGSNLGYNGIGNNHNGLYSSLNGRSYSGQSINGMAPTGNSSHESNTNGNVNYDSLSKSNSSSYNPDFSSVGMAANAASSASSSQGGSSGDAGSSSNDASSVSKSYEIKEIDELLSDSDAMIQFLIYAFITLFLLIVGYRHKKEENEEY